MLKTTRFALASVAALGFALLGVAASAQDYDGDYDRGAPGTYEQAPPGGYYSGAPNESVTIYAPRYHEERSTIGAPIENVSLSQPVSFEDLDLRTAWGAHELHERVRASAYHLCHRLEVMYPVAADNNPPCYRNALYDADYQVDSAIAYARGYARR